MILPSQQSVVIFNDSRAYIFALRSRTKLLSLFIPEIYTNARVFSIAFAPTSDENVFRIRYGLSRTGEALAPDIDVYGN